MMKNSPVKALSMRLGRMANLGQTYMDYYLYIDTFGAELLNMEDSIHFQLLMYSLNSKEQHEGKNFVNISAGFDWFSYLTWRSAGESADNSLTLVVQPPAAEKDGQKAAVDQIQEKLTALAKYENIPAEDIDSCLIEKFSTDRLKNISDESTDYFNVECVLDIAVMHKVLHEASRVLKPGAVLSINNIDHPDYQHISAAFHIWSLREKKRFSVIFDLNRAGANGRRVYLVKTA